MSELKRGAKRESSCQQCATEFVSTYDERTGWSKYCSRTCRGLSKRIDLTGRRYGHLVALEREAGRVWRFRCDCGGEASINANNVSSRYKQGARIGTKTCGRCNLAKGGGAPEIDRTGQRFGSLLVLEKAPDLRRGKQMKRRWLCRCDCGIEVAKVMTDLTRARGVKSCGGCRPMTIVRQRRTLYPAVTTSHRPCIICGVTKPLGDFFPAKNMASGRGCQCKDCLKTRLKAVADKGCKELADWYIKQYLKHSNPWLRTSPVDIPIALIEATRARLALRRLIKEKMDENAK